MCACGPCAVCIVIAEYTFREYVFIFSVKTQQQEHLKGSVKEPNISIYFFFLPITRWCSVLDVLFTGGKGVLYLLF